MSATRMDLAATARELASMRPGRLVLVDAGAAAGVPRRWRPVEELLLVVGFEPDARTYAALDAEEGRVWLNTALWEESATLELHIARKDRNTSVFAPNRAFLSRFPTPERFEAAGSARVEATTLDDALASAAIPRADFLKVDVQGAELPVLRGARSTLGAGAFGVEVEVAFAPIYDGQALFGELDQFLRGEGFDLIDLRRVYWKPARYTDTWDAKGQLVAGDALYLRSPGKLLELLEGPQREDAQAVVVNALVTCAIYGYPSLGLELVDEAAEAGLLERSVAARARALLQVNARYGLERLPAAARPRVARLAASVQRSAQRVQEASDRFAPAGGWPPGRKRRGRHGDGELGNA